MGLKLVERVENHTISNLLSMIRITRSPIAVASVILDGIPFCLNTRLCHKMSMIYLMARNSVGDNALNITQHC